MKKDKLIACNQEDTNDAGALWELAYELLENCCLDDYDSDFYERVDFYMDNVDEYIKNCRQNNLPTDKIKYFINDELAYLAEFEKELKKIIKKRGRDISRKYREN